MRLAVACSLLCLFAGSAEALEIWLARSESCNSCATYQRAAQLRGYGRVLRYPDASGAPIDILSINKRVMAADILSQLPEDVGPAHPSWDLTLTVLVVNVGRVLFAANIAESADNDALRHSQAVMFPPAVPEDDDPALRDEDIYSSYFERHWNLEYFVDVALGKRPRRLQSSPVDLASQSPAVLGTNNVVLWGSARTPLQNSLFIPTRISEIRAMLERSNLGAVRYVTAYGHGPGVQANDTSYIEGGRTLFERADIGADYAADAAGLNSVLTGVMQSDRVRTLVVQVGHSGPTGSPLWGHGLPLAPADLEPIRHSGGSTIMVSGACNSGQFAKALQCGFFAAHPEVRSTGCQQSPEALQTSDDYLRHFFTAASEGARGDSRARRRRAPPPTLYDAHWYASIRLEDHQLSYTTTDALIDDYFAAHVEDLPASMTVAEIRSAAAGSTGAEAAAAAALTEGLAPETVVPLTGYVEANHAADALLADATELPSTERNRIAALPYKLILPLLTRRIVYASLNLNDADYAAAASCERQSLQDFFGDAG